MTYANTGLTPKTLTDLEQARLLKVTGEHVAGLRDHVIFALALATGLREHELLGLDWGDLIHLERVRTHVQLRVFKESNPDAEQQRVMLSPRIREKIAKFRAVMLRDFGAARVAHDAPVFVSREGNRLSERMLRVAFKTWQERAGFERHFSFHSLRHTACTNLYRETKDIRLVQRFARHAAVTSTQIYTHSSDEEMLRAIERLAC